MMLAVGVRSTLLRMKTHLKNPEIPRAQSL